MAPENRTVYRRDGVVEIVERQYFKAHLGRWCVYSVVPLGERGHVNVSPGQGEVSVIVTHRDARNPPPEPDGGGAPTPEPDGAPEALGGPFSRVCAWCKARLGPAPEGCGGDTHGICPACAEEQRRRLRPAGDQADELRALVAEQVEAGNTRARACAEAFRPMADAARRLRRGTCRVCSDPLQPGDVTRCADCAARGAEDGTE